MADYAVVLMACIDKHSKTLLSASQIAGLTSLPEAATSKILKSLQQAGLLRSKRGQSGGYELAYTANNISVAQIIAAVDGPIALTACLSDIENDCSMESLCPTRNGWDKVNKKIKEALHSISLQEIWKN